MTTMYGNGNHAVLSKECRVFSLAGKGLKLDTHDDIAPHLVELTGTNAYDEIHVNGNTFGLGACKALAEAIGKQKFVKLVNLADIFTGRSLSDIPPSLKVLCDALLNLEWLAELDLSHNAFGSRSAEPMVTLLSNHRSLAVLRLTNNGLGPVGGAVVANALLKRGRDARADGKPSKLTTVICGRNRLENGSAGVWAEAFAAHGTLTEVALFQNGIRMEGIESIARGLQACPRLQILDLQDNTATISGSRAIAASFASWPLLRSLNLSDCLLRPKGALALVEALARGMNTDIESLCLQSDEIDKRAIEALARAVRAGHLPKLAAVELNGNRVEGDHEAMSGLREALEASGFPEALDEIDDVEEVDSDDEDEAEDADDVEDDVVPAVAAPAPATSEDTADLDELTDLVAKARVV